LAEAEKPLISSDQGQMEHLCHGGKNPIGKVRMQRN
jgi:hypothetical protein